MAKAVNPWEQDWGQETPEEPASDAAPWEQDWGGPAAQGITAEPVESNGIGRAQSAVGEFMQGAGSMIASVPKAVGEGSIAVANLFGDNPVFGNPEKFTPEDTAAHELGQSVDDWFKDTFPTNPQYSEEFTQKLAGGAGSMALFALGGFAGAAAKLPGYVVPAGIGAAAEGVSGAEDYVATQKAKGLPVDPEMRAKALAAHAPLGLTEAVPIQRLLNRVDKVTGGGVKRVIAEGAKGGVEELTQEVFQKVGGNLIANSVLKYDPDRKTWEGAQEAGEVGGTLGFLFNSLAAAVGIKMNKARDRAEGVPEAGQEVEPAQGVADEPWNADYKDVAPETAVEPEPAPVVVEEPAPVVEAQAESVKAAEPKEEITTPEVEPAVGAAFKKALKVAKEKRKVDKETEVSLEEKPAILEEKTVEPAPEKQAVKPKVGPKLKATVEAYAGKPTAEKPVTVRDLVDEGVISKPEKITKPETKLDDLSATIVKSAQDHATEDKYKNYLRGRLGKVEFAKRQGEIKKAWAGKSVAEKPSSIEAEKINIDKPVTALDKAAHEAATSPLNDLPEPTDAQKHAGNYKLGHAKINNLDISIENPVGSVRSGTDKDGESWSITMKHSYGYIKGTIGKDKDHLDIFLGPEAENSDLPVFVVDQVNPGTTNLDEHKIMMGFRTKLHARKGYLANYAKGWKGVGDITEMSIDEFKQWLETGDTKKAAALFKPAKKTGQAGRQEGTASWVIRNKATGDVVMETFDKKKVDALNTEKYEAVPILQHLQELNVKTKRAAKPEKLKSAKKKQPAVSEEKIEPSGKIGQLPAKETAEQYADLNGKKISYDVKIEDTGEVMTVTQDAGKVMRSMDKRIKSMKALLDCLK